jgi:hypothetical protein
MEGPLRFTLVLITLGQCETYCTENAGDCFTHETSPSLVCDDPEAGSEPGPVVLACE